MFSTMNIYQTLVFLLCSLILECRAVDENEEFESLHLPEDYKIPENLSQLGKTFREFNINFLKNQLKSPASVGLVSRLWTTTSRMLNPNYWLGTQPHPHACESKRGIITERGKDDCQQKCKEENEAYVTFANNKLPYLFNVLGMTHLKARFIAINENIYECTRGLIFQSTFTCICKRNAATEVNQDLQDSIDEFFGIKKEKENQTANPNEKFTDNRKTTAVSRFLGFLAVFIYFPKWIRSFIVWWMYTPK